METTTNRARLNEAVARQVLAQLSLRRMRQVALAKQLGQSEVWLSRRLRGVQALTLDDIEAICRVLKMEPAELITLAVQFDEQTRLRKFPQATRPTPTGPKGRHDRQDSIGVDLRRKFRISDPLTVANLRSAA